VKGKCEEFKREEVAEKKVKERAYLVHTPKLKVNVEVFFIQCLESRVKQPTQQWALNLLDNLCPGLLRVVFRYNGAEFVVVEVIFFCELVRRPLNKLEL